MKRLAVIRFWYEGNAFSPVVASRQAFQRREWVAGEAAARFYQGQRCELGAVVDIAARHADIDVRFILCAAAYPAGPIASGLADEFLQRVETDLGGDVDGVYVSLHGASVFEDEHDFEVRLLALVRRLVGGVPIAASFDLHANLHPHIASLAEIVVGYKTYPHVDMYQTGAKAVALLMRSMAGEIAPASVIVPAEFAPTSFNMRTGDGPMRDIATAARALERSRRYYDVTPFGGFVYADSPQAGAAISICAEANDARTTDAAQELAGLFRQFASRFDTRLPRPEAVLAGLRALSEDENAAVLEPSDNPFSGGAGDTPGLLRSVIETVPDLPGVFAFFTDAELVRAAHSAGLGARLRYALGGRLASWYGPPVLGEGTVDTLTEGRFTNAGPMDTGLVVDLGRTTVLRTRGLRIIVTTENAPVNDPEYFRLHGIDLRSAGIVYVKAKNHFRAAFARCFDRIYEVETAGPAPSDLSTLAFESIPPHRLKTS